MPPWLAITFPVRSTDRWQRETPEQPPGSGPAPLVLVTQVGNSTRLAAAAPEARALGLLPGLALADARARVPHLLAAPHDPAADAALLRRLARLAGDVTPMVALQPPDALLLEIAASAHLFGGADGLARKLGARFRGLGLRQVQGLGDTPDAALAFARFPAAGTDWKRLPAAALGLGEEAEAALRRAGLRTLVEIAAQPRRALASRFGMEALTALDRIAAGLVRPLIPSRPPPSLGFEQRLAEPLLTAQAADRVLACLAARAATRLARLGLGGRRFLATLGRTDGVEQALEVESSRPLRDAPAILALFAERVAGLADPLNPGFGYDLVRLSVQAAEPLAPEQAGLDAAAREASALDDLVDRLSVRFGPGRLLRLLPADSHIPERSERWLPASRTAAVSGPTPPAPGEAPLLMLGETPMRPLFLLDPPERVDVLAEVPDGPPRRFRWRRMQHRVARAEGPERIAPEWWRRRTGALSGGRSRDYWRVEDVDGRRFWLFRAGLYEGGAPPPAWYLHGLFA
jgi:protein ImuB